MTSDLTFDEEQKVHLMPIQQQNEAQQIVSASGEYRKTLDEFNEVSGVVIAQIDALAQQTERHRKRALSLKALNAVAQQKADHFTAIGRAKLGTKMLELEAIRTEISSYERYQDAVKQTKTAITEILGGQ